MRDVSISLRIPDFMTSGQRRFMMTLGLHDNEEMRKIKRTLKCEEIAELVRYLNMVLVVAKMSNGNDIFIEVEHIDGKGL